MSDRTKTITDRIDALIAAEIAEDHETMETIVEQITDEAVDRGVESHTPGEDFIPARVISEEEWTAIKTAIYVLLEQYGIAGAIHNNAKQRGRHRRARHATEEADRSVELAERLGSILTRFQIMERDIAEGRTDRHPKDEEEGGREAQVEVRVIGPEQLAKILGMLGDQTKRESYDA